MIFYERKCISEVLKHLILYYPACPLTLELKELILETRQQPHQHFSLISADLYINLIFQ